MRVSARTLRAATIRLAYTGGPSLRRVLLPLLVGSQGRVAATVDRRRFRELLRDPATLKAVRRFLRRLEAYQSIGAPKQDFRRDYESLPAEVRGAFQPPSRGMKSLWRGDEGQSPEDALSWTRHRDYATMFGSFLFNSGRDLEEYAAAVDSVRVRALIDGTGLEDDFYIKDDEGEVILIGVRWKRQLTDDELERYRP